MDLCVELGFFRKMARMRAFLVLCTLVIGAIGASPKLEDISDENLHKSLETEHHVIVLFRELNEKCSVRYLKVDFLRKTDVSHENEVPVI